MRNANSNWIRKIHDTGFIPEGDLVDRLKSASAYDYMRSGKINLNEIIDAAENATMGDVTKLKTLQTYLKSSESAIRYWGATGLLILGEKARPAFNDLKIASEDKSLNVAIVAAEVLNKLGEKNLANSTFLRALKSPNKFIQCHALNAIESAGVIPDSEMTEVVVYLLKSKQSAVDERYLTVAAGKYLLEKWNVNPEKYNLIFN
jgi:N-sulfoglucosamine sulfohydrolase